MKLQNTRQSSYVSDPLDQTQVDELLAAPETDTNTSPSPSSTVGSNPSSEQEVSPAKLRHLLRLSALPPPASADEESRMLQQLEDQLSFVRQIQRVDVTGVEPLARIQDETQEAREENTASLENMKEELDREIWKGKHNKRVIGKTLANKVTGQEEWDVLGQASKRLGRFFVVEGGKSRSEEGSQTP